MANTKNVSRETSVKGTNNNVGQEIKPVKPSEVVATCTMTEEEHKARVNMIYEMQARGIQCEWTIMASITSAKERKEQTLDGYGDSEADFNKWVGDLFEIKDTQVKQMSRIMHVYGTLADNGEWSIAEKFTRYSKEKLDIIQSFPQFKTKANFDELVDALGITPATSCAVLKTLRAEAKGITQKEEPTKKEAEASETTEKTMSTKEVKEIKDSEPYKELDRKKDIMLKFISEHAVEAKKVADSKKNELAMAFVVKFLDDFKALEQEYQNK